MSRRGLTAGPALSLICLGLAVAGCDSRQGGQPKVPSAQNDPDAVRRARMVDSQIVARGVRDPRVLAAMRKVPRHEFVDPAQRASAYESSVADRGQPDHLPALTSWP